MRNCADVFSAPHATVYFKRVNAMHDLDKQQKNQAGGLAAMLARLTPGGELIRKAGGTPVKMLRQGFTLLEILVVLMIIGIIATFALPQYHSYVDRAKFAEGISIADALKSPVAACLARIDNKVNVNKMLEGYPRACSSGNHSIPPALGSGTNAMSEFIQSISVDNNGVISMEAVSALDGVTYKLTPVYSAASIEWTIGGNCASRGFC